MRMRFCLLDVFKDASEVKSEIWYGEFISIHQIFFYHHRLPPPQILFVHMYCTDLHKLHN